MFVEDIKNDFYNTLLGNRVLVLLHTDVDAICTCKILQNLFKCDNISYTLVPVGGIAELKSAYEENNEEIKFVVLINCGGTVDIVDILQPDEDVVFFVLDSHKPSDVCNVYSDGQVRLVYKDNDEEIPNFDDIFKDDDDQDESEENGGGEEGREAMAAGVLRRRERRAWEDKRNTLMFNYTQFSYIGKPSACIALELAWRMSRCGAAAAWAACVACESLAALQARAPAACLLDADLLHRHLASLHHDNNPHSASVSLEKDAWLPLYRSWSLESAVRHAPGFAPYLKLHTVKGETRLRQLLADMGFPLQQARQAYRSMDVALRNELTGALETASSKHGLPAPTRATFLLRRPFHPTLAALDMVYVIMALIEDESTPRAEGVELALAALSVEAEGAGGAAWRRGVQAAQRALAHVAALVQGSLAARQLHCTGPFHYMIVQEGIAEASSVRGPLWLGAAARWAAAASGGTRPVLASAPLTSSTAPGSAGTALLLGIPPRQADEPRNLFGKAFEQAALQCGCSVNLDYFDTSVITLPVSQRAQFLDALTALLS